MHDAVNAPADTSDFIAVHTSLRRGGRALAEAVAEVDPADRGRIEAVRRYWEGYTGEVLCHHTVEDDIFYPALVERAPVAAEHIGRIDEEHHLLDELMAEGNAAIASVVDGGRPAPAARVLAHLDRLMQDHLDYEETDLVPLFSANFDAAEYSELHKRAMKSLGIGRQALFTVPFIASWNDDDVRAELLDTAPLPFRVVYRLTRNGHERLAARALGDARERARRDEPVLVG